jgi:hypothetical protein
MIEKEEWKGIPNYEELYEISSFGRVKNKLTEKVLKLSVDNNGYLVLNLNKDHTKKTKRVHQLVAMTFLNHKPCGMKLVVDHINSVRNDNRVENLQIVTQKENILKQPNEKISNVLRYEKLISEYSKKTLINYNPIVFLKNNNKWVCQVVKNNRLVFLGCFDNKIEAMLTFINKKKINYD